MLAHLAKGGEKFLAWQRSKPPSSNSWGLGKNPSLKKDDRGYFLFMKTKERKTSIYLICDEKKNLTNVLWLVAEKHFATQISRNAQK